MRTLLITFMAALLLAPAAGILAKDGKDDGGDRKARRMERMAKKLDLTDKQKDAMKELHEKGRDRMMALGKAVGEAMRELKKLVKEEAGDDKIAAQLRKVEEAKAAMQAHHEKQKKAMAGILTPTQQAKMMLFMGRRMGEGMRGPGGMDRKGKRGDMDKECPAGKK